MDTINLHEWIEQILPILHNETGNGLIRCREGRSRSAYILIAYLIKYDDKSYEESIHYVQLKRPIVKPNPGFVKQLKQYERLLKDNK